LDDLSGSNRELRRDIGDFSSEVLFLSGIGIDLCIDTIRICVDPKINDLLQVTNPLVGPIDF